MKQDATIRLVRLNWLNCRDHENSIRELFECQSIRRWFPCGVNPDRVWKDWISRACDATSNQKAHSYLGYLGDNLIGLAGLRAEISKSVLALEIDWHVKSNYQGRGYGYQLARACMTGTLSDSIFRVIARVSPENEPSNRLAKKVGMIKSQLSDDEFNLWFTP